MTKISDLNRLGATWLGNGEVYFQAWAPLAFPLSVCLVDDPRPPVRFRWGSNDCVYALLEDVPLGAKYFFQLPDGTRRPDPASRAQPDGVHGPSQVIDHAFAWTDEPWRGRPWHEYVIYELHVGAFTPAGTFDAVIQRLDHLESLGVTAIELMPVAQFPGERNWGYDGVLPFAVQSSYGGAAGLKNLVNACHQRGLAVVLDVVYNHLGPEGNYLREFAPYFTDRYHTPWGAAINFDGRESDAVREYFLANALEWFTDYHIDALRLDATDTIFDQRATTFLQELAQATKRCGNAMQRPLFLIAENHLNDPRIVTPRAAGGVGLDAVLLDDFQRSLHALLTREDDGHYRDFGDATSFAKAYDMGFVLTGQYSRHHRCRWGADSSHLPADRFVGFAQNHDTVGNHPSGRRLGHIVDFETLKLSAAATLLAPSIPLLFMGEEFDAQSPFYYFTSHGDAQLAAAVQAGRERELREKSPFGMQPDPQAVETFLSSKLDWDRMDWILSAALLRCYQEMLHRRRLLPAIGQPERSRQSVTAFESLSVLVAHRASGESEVCLCYNFSDEPRELTQGLPISGRWLERFDTSHYEWEGPRNSELGEWRPHSPLHVRPRSCLMLQRADHA